jgi:hypothetical protein
MSNALDLRTAKDYDPGRDPASIGWPPTLPVEIALKTAPMNDIRDAYGYSPEEWMRLKDKMVKKEGESFRWKAKLHPRSFKTSWRLIHAPTDLEREGRGDRAGSTTRSKWVAVAPVSRRSIWRGGGPNFAIQINLR